MFFSAYLERPENNVMDVDLAECWTSCVFSYIFCVASERARKHTFLSSDFLSCMPRRRVEEEQEKKTCKFFDPLLVLALAETRHGRDA